MEHSDEQFETLAATLRIPVQDDLSEYMPVTGYVRHFDIAFSRDHKVLLMQLPAGPALAVCDLKGVQKLDLIRRRLGVAIDLLRTSEAELFAAINRAYESRNSETQQFIDSLDDVQLRIDENDIAADDLLDSDGRGPIVRMVNLILFEAVKAKASDVHIQPSESRVAVRQRIDGVLFDSFEIPKHMQEQVLTRIKVLGGMDIAEKRLPQDGRATIHVGDREIDLRIASLPTSHNERIVIRLLDRSARLYRLGELGMDGASLEQYRRLIQLDHGMLLVTGPTGSGKSTTLYASLLEVNTTDLNVLSIEDPIEYQLAGVSQTQINEKKGMTFAAGLRSVLRQDPDIIMVGEIRDAETASMSVQASLTGHLVFSTLHTNDAASAVTRLLDLGIEPYLVSSSLVAVLAQRLVRRICRDCAGAGCPECRQTGFRGRLGIFELLTVNDDIRTLIQNRSNAASIREVAVAGGMTLLREDGLRKVEANETTMEEINRVSGIVEGV